MDASFYQRECNKRGVRIYPVRDGNLYKIVIEFNRRRDWHKSGIQDAIPGQQRYDRKGKEWIEKIHQKYKQIYQTRILPRINKGKEVRIGTLCPPKTSDIYV